jgi:3-oxoacyl-[acyl-carrier-protein] synthase II
MLGRIGDFDAAAAIDPAKRRRMPRLGQLCVVAAQQALGGPAALDFYGRERAGVVLGTGLGALDTLLEFTTQYIQGGLGGGSPALFPYTVMNAAAATVAMELGLSGPNITINHRDLSLAEAVLTGCNLLSCGRLDAALVGGCDELGAGLLHAYARLGALPKSGEMLPYDRHRQGFWPGEGAVLLLLERAAAAAARGAKVLGRIAGFGRGADDRPCIGWRRSGQEPAINGAAEAVVSSLAMAGLAAPDIDFIASGGNGTDLDLLETLTLRRALGPAAEHVSVASILGQTGEWMTSAGVRLAAGLYALAEQALPGTRCHAPDPAATLPGLCLLPRPAASPIRHVLLPTLAQGGGNVSLVLAHA